MQALPNHIIQQEDRLKTERERIETALIQKRDAFQKSLKGVKQDIQEIKELGLKGQATDALEKIKRVNAQLSELTDEM